MSDVRLIDANALKFTCIVDKCNAPTGIGCNKCQYYVITECEIDNAPTVEISPQDNALNEIIKYLKDDTVTWRDISDDIIIQILEDNGLWSTTHHLKVMGL